MAPIFEGELPMTFCDCVKIQVLSPDVENTANGRWQYHSEILILLGQLAIDDNYSDSHL